MELQRFEEELLCAIEKIGANEYLSHRLDIPDYPGIESIHVLLRILEDRHLFVCLGIENDNLTVEKAHLLSRCPYIHVLAINMCENSYKASIIETLFGKDSIIPSLTLYGGTLTYEELCHLFEDRHNKLTHVSLDVSLEEFSEVPLIQLRTPPCLAIDGCRNIAEVVMASTTLRELSLTGYEMWDPNIFEAHTSTNLLALTLLEFDETPIYLASLSIPYLESFVSLRALSISPVDDNTISDIAKYCTRLRCLELRTDDNDVLASIGTSLQTLSFLSDIHLRVQSAKEAVIHEDLFVSNLTMVIAVAQLEIPERMRKICKMAKAQYIARKKARKCFVNMLIDLLRSSRLPKDVVFSSISRLSSLPMGWTQEELYHCAHTVMYGDIEKILQAKRVKVVQDGDLVFDDVFFVPKEPASFCIVYL